MSQQIQPHLTSTWPAPRGVLISKLVSQLLSREMETSVALVQPGTVGHPVALEGDQGARELWNSIWLLYFVPAFSDSAASLPNDSFDACLLCFLFWIGLNVLRKLQKLTLFSCKLSISWPACNPSVMFSANDKRLVDKNQNHTQALFDFKAIGSSVIICSAVISSVSWSLWN